ncbi:hypothetical protein Lpp122_2411, partial [Lacticaseibacillus paracasei subsp. paracasei Lpp122]
DVFEGMVANQLYIELETVLLPEILRLSQKDTVQNTSDDK